MPLRASSSTAEAPILEADSKARRKGWPVGSIRTATFNSAKFLPQIPYS